MIGGARRGIGEGGSTRPRPLRAALPAVLLVALALAGAGDVAAIEDRADVEPNHPVSEANPIAWKLTLGHWRDSVAATAVDLNLRGNDEDDAFWLGLFDDRDGFRQVRAGWERQFAVPFGRLIASGQLASRGFAGGSFTAEISPQRLAPWSVLIGWGRTNTRPYYNLNFDPNDSVLIGGSWKPAGDTAITLYQVRDDRLDTRQRVTHLVMVFGGHRRHVGIDLFHRAGWADAVPDGDPVRSWGLGLTLERSPFFGRVVWDPRANFGPGNMLRLSAGLRF